MLMAGAVKEDVFEDIRCDNVHRGRFAAIFLDNPGILTVCEFEVYGGKFPMMF